MKYKILEHPADLKIQAFGKNLPEVFLFKIRFVFHVFNKNKYIAILICDINKSQAPNENAPV
ncbi:MAG: hypothetical protein HY813_02850 [Candidatus Portnoybacteria bacterium]|nr:hypothetical protein [Candidatus Portnoybacteria bacterium]